MSNFKKPLGLDCSALQGIENPFFSKSVPVQLGLQLGLLKYRTYLNSDKFSQQAHLNMEGNKNCQKDATVIVTICNSQTTFRVG